MKDSVSLRRNSASAQHAYKGPLLETFTFVFIFGYFVPTFVAMYRSMPNKGSVIVVNVFLGWTFVGWVVALAMACGSKKST